jgi:hypothetical protein
VVLPAPLGPIKPNAMPRGTSRLNPPRACLCCPPSQPEYTFVTARASMASTSEEQPRHGQGDLCVTRDADLTRVEQIERVCRPGL